MISQHQDIISYFGLLDNFTIVGIGNIVGWGDQFIKELKRQYKKAIAPDPKMKPMIKIII